MPQNKITLLNECVAQEDSYKNGTHQKIADTLYHLIESDNEAITIGLEGEWGTGKSTVINLLEQKFNNGSDDKTLFFKFDAWSHDGDPLRITFLEKLIRQIKNDLIADEENEDTHEKLDELLIKATGKVKTTTNTSVKTSSKFGKLLATSIMLVPIGSALFSKSYDYNNTSFIPYKIIQDINSNGITLNILEIIKSFAFLPTVSVLLLLAPLLLLLCWVFLVKGKDSISDKWEFISSTSKDKIVQDIIEQGDKTSFEFERLFTQTIDITVGNNKPYSKIIIVIDNMDRVSHDHAKNIWSTLQVFITNDHPNSKLMWFIIPFDEYIFKKIWPIEKNHEGNNNDYTSNQFTEKCFQLVIDVPTPITSNWIDYLKKMSDKAFEKWNDPNLSRDFIKQYRDYFSTVNHSPTPRSINNIINQVQALQTRFMHEKNITINAITVYSLLRRTKSKSEIKDLILYPQSQKVSSSILARVKMYQRELSSILFYVPYERGLELLLSSEISKIINSDNDVEYARLVSLQEDNEDAFWQAWDSNFQALDYETSNENIHKSATFLHVASEYLFEKTNHYLLLNYITAIKNSFHIDARILFKEYGYEKAYNYIKDLLKLTKVNDKDIATITSIISDSINSFIEYKEDNLNVTFTSHEVTMDLSSIHKIIELLKIKYIPCDRINSLKAFSIWCDQQNKIGVAIPNVFPNESAFREITRSIFSANHLSDDTLKKVHDMATLNPLWAGWENAIDHICDWAKKPTSISQRSAYNSHSNIRSVDSNSMFFSLVQTLNTHSNSNVKKTISELLSNESFKNGLHKEILDNNGNKSLALLIKHPVENGEITLNNEQQEIIKKLWQNDDASYSNGSEV